MPDSPLQDTSIKVLLVEDDPAWQAALTALLASENRFQVVATATDYDAALQAWRLHQPELVLLDYELLGPQTGLDVAQALSAQGFPAEKMILVTATDPAQLPRHGLTLVPKPQAAEQLLEVLERVLMA